MIEGNKMKYFLLLLHACILIPAAGANSADVVVVQSIARPVHEKILSGINSVMKEKPVIANVDQVRTNFRSKPKLFIAIGPDALNAVKNLGVPVVLSMVMNPHSMGLEGKQVTGIDLFISIEAQLDELRAVLPKATRVGVIYAPHSTGYIVELAKEAAKKEGFTIVGRAVRSADEAIVAMDGLTGVDVFWMLPDTTVITQETVKHLLLLSLERKIPVYALSEKYVKNGALMALGIDPTLLGRQIGEMANRVLSGENASSIPFEPIKSGNLYINTSIARYLKLHIPLDVLGRAYLYKGGER
jgi:putative ABC transport system substrate-binding protein